MKNIALALFLAITLGGCQRNDEKLSPVVSTEMALDYAPAKAHRSLSMEADGAGPAHTTDPMVIRTAFLSLEVENYQAGRAKIDSLIALYSARIVSESMQNLDHRITTDFRIRVPEARLDPMLAAILDIARRVDHQRVESTDITEEYIDVEARLNNQRQVEETFVKLLRRAQTVEDVLRIESMLAEIRGKIESLVGRMNYLKSQSEYSTIHLTLYQKVDFTFSPERPKPFTEQLKKALNMGWRGIVAIALLVFTLWPLWLVGAAVWGGIVLYRRHKRNAKAESKVKKKDKGKEKGKAKAIANDRQLTTHSPKSTE